MDIHTPRKTFYPEDVGGDRRVYHVTNIDHLCLLCSYAQQVEDFEEFGKIDSEGHLFRLLLLFITVAKKHYLLVFGRDAAFLWNEAAYRWNTTAYPSLFQACAYNEQYRSIFVPTKRRSVADIS